MSSPGNDSPANKKPTSAEPVPDRSTADVGIVCTHKGELKAFLKRVDRQRSYTEKKITVRGGFLGETIRLAIAEAGEGCLATIEMPKVHPLIAPLVYAVPVQLLAYHVACAKGTDVDQPRNLAKSVTVE